MKAVSSKALEKKIIFNQDSIPNSTQAFLKSSWKILPTNMKLWPKWKEDKEFREEIKYGVEMGAADPGEGCHEPTLQQNAGGF